MIKDFLKKQTETTLWHMLADVSTLMTNRKQLAKTSDILKADEFWLNLGHEITTEIDNRLFLNYENDNDDLDEEEDF